MGHSIELIEKKPIVFSIEIDRELHLEMSTGFGPGGRGQSVTMIPVTVSDLESAVKTLNGIIDDLKKSWVCGVCSQINKGDESECDNCDTERHEQSLTYLQKEQEVELMRRGSALNSISTPTTKESEPLNFNKDDFPL